MARPSRRRLALGTLFLAACSTVAAILVFVVQRPPARPTFSQVRCTWRSGKVVVSGVMHAEAGGTHDYWVRPLFRLDNGRLDDLTDRFYYHVRQGQDIAWREAILPDWRGETITYCSARGAVMTRGGDEAD
ncbi:MAG TPA: hypothetical protein VJU80_03705 [Solirubrobacteraceae bacterium]|nr:hypothetical protein [Solirubrobacteraceae bacterium]